LTNETTPDEGKLAQTYAETMDFVSRCAQALADGDWHYLSDKTGQLRMRVEELEQAADAAAALERTPQSPRRDVVLAEVIRRGRNYRAVALLHSSAIDPNTRRPQLVNQPTEGDAR
jgi:hypothetical protein